MKLLTKTVALSVALSASVLCCSADAQQDSLRTNLSKNVPNLPKIVAVTATPIPQIFELQLEGNEIIYADAQGKYIFQGSLIDAVKGENLTKAREEALNQIDFAKLPFEQGFSQVRGTGKRKLAVFVDPNCGYCKQFEAQLQSVSDITIHWFLYPVLGEDSTRKAQAIWCSKDRANTWLNWMLQGKPPVMTKTADCDSLAITKNIAFGQAHHVSGTPALFFANGKRVPGAVSATQLEQLLNDATVQ